MKFKTLIIKSILLLLLLPSLISQTPLAEIEGRLSIYMPSDSTSLSIGKDAGANTTSIQNQLNTFVGNNSGSKNTITGLTPPYNSGTSNSFFGSNAGASSTTGSGNSFFGSRSGESLNRGFENSFFGAESGQNTKGHILLEGNYLRYAYGNSFYGFQAGWKNESGRRNAFFGAESGYNNIGPIAGAPLSTGNDGTDNAYFGFSAGRTNVAGKSNVILGSKAGNTSGSSNVIIGYKAGNGSKGSNNILIGNAAGPPDHGLSTN